MSIIRLLIRETAFYDFSVSLFVFRLLSAAWVQISVSLPVGPSALPSSLALNNYSRHSEFWTHFQRLCRGPN